MSVLVFLIQWLAVLQLLKEDPAEDQYGKAVTWNSFASKPFVLVIGDREAADRAREIGAALHTAHNPRHIKPEMHLHTTTADEKIKVIAVAALPDVPGIFKGLFRSGFKDEGMTGVILDWDRLLSRACGYRDGTVLLVFKSPASDTLKILEVSSKEAALGFVSKCLLNPN